MKTSQIFLLGAASAAILALAGCGGGGGSPVASNTGVAANRSAIDLASELITKTNQLLATGTPSSGASSQSLNDACYLSDGGTKAYWIQKYDMNLALSQASNAYRIGSTRTGLTVLAERNTTNADGSARREIDIQYDINYTDGSKDTAAKNTLVIGSSAGSCASPQDLNTARYLGNRQIVETYVQSRNLRYENYSITTGNGLSVTSRREVNFGVNDPMGNASYVVITGPGESTQGGVTQTTLSMKLLSPRIVRDDALMAVPGKRGYSTSFKDDDGYRACRYLLNTVSTATIQASPADCVNAGTGGANWGVTHTPPSQTYATRDAVFDTLKFVAGGVYTFAVYNDDGWKTINGQANKTPIATYTRTLEKLPYTFAEMQTTSGGSSTGIVLNHKFPTGVSLVSTPSVLHTMLSAGNAGSFTSTWTAPPALSDADIFKSYTISEYASGPSVSNATGVVYPEIRDSRYLPLLGNATSATVPVTAKPSTMSNKTYAEFALGYTNRNGGRIISYLTWQ